VKTKLNERVSENLHVRELFSLRDRVALVTGGAGRYGRQICQALAEAGATVIVASRSYDKCEAFAEELREGDSDVEALRLDVTDESSLRAASSGIESRWGRLDVLFNSAVVVKAEPVAEHSPEEWARAMESNSTALYRTIRVFGEMMTRQRAGSIVNMASIYGIVSPDFRIYEGCAEMTNPPSYGFAKAGMIQLTRYLAVHLAAQGVRVNCISPGGLFSETMPSRFVTEYVKRTPLGRMAAANDLKGAVVFLASDASGYVTGQNLIVDGGYTAL
jgi:NAD(P)-dependent dehydrogenase (short-subunit alcohol dehydrogenase family)